MYLLRTVVAIGVFSITGAAHAQWSVEQSTANFEVSPDKIPTSKDDTNLSNNITDSELDSLGLWKSNGNGLGLGLELHNVNMTYIEFSQNEAGNGSTSHGFTLTSIAPGVRYSKRHFVNQNVFVDGSGDALLPVLLGDRRALGNDRLKFRQVNLAGRAKLSVGLKVSDSMAISLGYSLTHYFLDMVDGTGSLNQRLASGYSLGFGWGL